jgi:hypothetical protein
MARFVRVYARFPSQKQVWLDGRHSNIALSPQFMKLITTTYNPNRSAGRVVVPRTGQHSYKPMTLNGAQEGRI